MSGVIAEPEDELPVQPSLRRIREFDVRPKHDLGQNFLIDSNILGVIDRLAELGSGDVVLEIGGGLGVLSEHLAPLCGHLHVIELDRALKPHTLVRSGLASILEDERQLEADVDGRLPSRRIV